ncbi:unnamed protein product [Closterium sp. NIES-65]|nr:unnamed protein product [Closterium sp. NIES-65]
MRAKEQTPAEAAGADKDVARAVVEEEAVEEVDEEGALGNVAGVGQPLQPRVGSLRASMSFAKALTKVRPATRPPIPLIRVSKLSPTNGLHAATRALLHAGAPSPLAPPLMTFAPFPPMHHLPPTSIMSSPNTSPLTSSSKSNTSSPHPPPPQHLPSSPHPPSHLKPPPPILLSPLILLLTGPTLPTPHLCMAMGQLQLLHLLNYPPPPLTPPASHHFPPLPPRPHRYSPPPPLQPPHSRSTAQPLRAPDCTTTQPSSSISMPQIRPPAQLSCIFTTPSTSSSLSSPL